MKLILACVLAFFAASVAADHYAVLVAGSNTYANYRHQADVSHAYQIVTKYGIPASNIITMMYDDIASNEENPFPGKIFNRNGTDAPDVYQGVKIDYKGADVTAANFLAVLTGDSSTTGGKPVLQSTENDLVFVNFVDHGANGLVAFPSGGYLYADKLLAALATMGQKKMYKQLVFYMEACESGSMFVNLPTDSNIYATTAANPNQSSWGTYCPPNDMVNGKNLQTCLGDLYSVNWMQNSDKGDKETLEAQYKLVATETTKSEVMQYGQQTFTSEAIGQFQGDMNSANPILPAFTAALRLRGATDDDLLAVRQPTVHVDSREASMHSLYHRYIAASGDLRARLGEALRTELAHRAHMTRVFDVMADTVFGERAAELKSYNLPATAFDCHRAVDAAVEAKCGKYGDYTLKFHNIVVNMCETADEATVLAAVDAACLN
eukprot:PLAT9108.2.p1 GENE.PLAT9108.2~~PLAT9108.2.p1  ORF type:complete len:436 (+),score=229.28 PLAT9108.2:77-1384(+)